MRTDEFDYDLPADLIAQTPLLRGESRLLILGRKSGDIAHSQFSALPGHLHPGDTLVLNDTRVAARRLAATRESGHPAEVLLIAPYGERSWESLVKPGRRIHRGDILHLEAGPEARVVESTPYGGRILEFRDEPERDSLANAGAAPLPPYIHETLEDEGRYQTVFARHAGSAAAPTAGLHFTEEMLSNLESQRIDIVRITLHVGVDTFRPVRTDSVEDHVMHGEWYSISEQAADRINSTRGRIVAAGTTVVRALESAADGPGKIRSITDTTLLFITPGFEFKIVQGMLTNFHLPKSTLLTLVSAFAGRDSVINAYRTAVDQRYRFYSFGDAMLIA